jgi:hypothetical protein
LVENLISDQMCENLKKKIDENIAEISLLFFILTMINWFLFSIVFIGFINHWIAYFQNFNLIGIGAILTPFILLLWLCVSLWSYHSLWDRLKRIPILSSILKFIFTNVSAQNIQNFFTYFWPLLFLFSLLISYFLHPILSFIILLIIWFALFFYCGVILIFSIPFYIFGVIALRKEKFKKIDQNEIHNAIIVTHYKFQIKTPVYGDGFPKLITYFQKNNLPYMIYNCYEPEDLKIVVNNLNAQFLWIFGHGFRGGLNFGAGRNQYYSELKDAPRKQFIGQFHCNPQTHPTEKSLAELISTWGYVTDGPISDVEIRNAIDTLVNIKKYN